MRVQNPIIINTFTSFSKINAWQLILNKLPPPVILLIPAQANSSPIKAVRGFLSLENAGIPHSKVTKARMLIHPDFPVRMVQWGWERNSSTPIIEQAAQPPHPAQVDLLWPTIFHSFLPSRKRSVSGKDQVPIHLIKVPHRKAKLSERAEGLNTRGLSPNKPSFPPSSRSIGQKSNFLSAGGHQQSDPVRY